MPMPTHLPRFSDAFDQAVLPHMNELYAASMRLTRSPSDSEDLVQEAVLKAWAHFPRFEQGTNARAWVHRILINTFINGYRRKKRERDLLTVARTEAVVKPFEEHHERAQDEGVGDEVQAALGGLPEEFRSVVELVDFEDLSYKEVARRLDCPIGTVMSRLHRARRILKQRLRTYAVQEGYLAQAA